MSSNLALFNTSEGRLRVLSALVLAPIFLGVVFLGGPAYGALVALMTAVGLFEWTRLVDPEAPMIDRTLLTGALIVAVLLAAGGLPSFGLIVVALAGVASYAHRSNMVDPKMALWFALGLPYMAVSGIALVYLRDLPSDIRGTQATIYLLAVVWGMDIGAYIIGRIVGGPKLAPVISPNKTWSGFFGGMALGAGLAVVVLVAAPNGNMKAGIVIALLLAAIAQGGDLFKSFFKRRAGVKDCGNIIPGHGGVLDRIDGLVFAALALAFFEAVLGIPF